MTDTALPITTFPAPAAARGPLPAAEVIGRRSRPAPDRSRTHPGDRATSRHRPAGPSRGAFALLDHRTRSRAVPPEQAAPGHYLAVEHGAEELLIPLEQRVVRLGRGLTADVRIEDPRISRHHAIIARNPAGSGARVLDDRSSNGTFVNGRRVTVAAVTDGDVVRLDRVVFRFVEVRPVAGAPPIRRMPLSAVARRRISAPA